MPDRVTWEFPPLPTWTEALLGESVSRPEAEVRRALGMPPADTDATLSAVDAAVEGRCAGCGTPLDPDGPSAYFCSPGCSDAWQRQQAGPASPGSAPVRGSEEVAVGPMRWRPDLVAAFDDTGLELLEEMRPAGRGNLTRRWYRHLDGRRFLRIDDGHRWVGAYADLEDGPQVELWRRLERELGDPRRLAPDITGPCPSCVNRCEPGCGCTCWGTLAGASPEATAALVAAGERIREAGERAEGERAVLSGGVDPRAEGTVFWLADPPADLESPTAAELAGGIDLTPYLAPAGTRPAATWVDETHVDAEPPHRWRERVDLVVLGEGNQPEVVTGEPGKGRPRVPVNVRVLAEIVVPPSWRLARGVRTTRRWLARAVRTAEELLLPLARCPGHGRRECFPCGWSGRDVVDAVAMAHRGTTHHPYGVRINLRVDTSGYEEGMARAAEAFRRAGQTVAEFGAEMTATFQSMPLVTQQAIRHLAEAESDRVALRAVCADEAMYERALEQARTLPLTVRQVSEAVTLGWYTDTGWTDPAIPAGIVGLGVERTMRLVAERAQATGDIDDSAT